LSIPSTTIDRFSKFFHSAVIRLKKFDGVLNRFDTGQKVRLSDDQTTDKMAKYRPIYDEVNINQFNF